jgi:hypothetical protein
MIDYMNSSIDKFEMPSGYVLINSQGLAAMLSFLRLLLLIQAKSYPENRSCRHEQYIALSRKHRQLAGKINSAYGRQPLAPVYRAIP